MRRAHAESRLEVGSNTNKVAEERRFANGLRVDIEWAGSKHEITTFQRCTELGDGGVIGASKQPWVQAAPVGYRPRHAVRVKRPDPRVYLVSKTASRAPVPRRLARKADGARDELVEVTLHDLGGEADAVGYLLAWQVQTDVQVVRKCQMHCVHINSMADARTQENRQPVPVPLHTLMPCKS